jgi:hypothetical protein
MALITPAVVDENIQVLVCHTILMVSDSMTDLEMLGTAAVTSRRVYRTHTIGVANMAASSNGSTPSMAFDKPMLVRTPARVLAKDRVHVCLR